MFNLPSIAIAIKVRNENEKLTMNKIPKRPKVNESMVRDAAKIIADKLNGNVEDIVNNYSHPMDGYDLAKNLDKWCGWDISRDEMESLDEIENIVDKSLKAAEKKWFDENNINPPFPIGTKITKGLITGIDEYGIARYLVKENGCTIVGRSLIIKFEDAVPLPCQT